MRINELSVGSDYMIMLIKLQVSIIPVLLYTQ